LRHSCIYIQDQVLQPCVTLLCACVMGDMEMIPAASTCEIERWKVEALKRLIARSCSMNYRTCPACIISFKLPCFDGSMRNQINISKQENKIPLFWLYGVWFGHFQVPTAWSRTWTDHLSESLMLRTSRELFTMVLENSSVFFQAPLEKLTQRRWSYTGLLKL